VEGGDEPRRTGLSIDRNGKCRPTTGAYAHHVGIALGSQGELETCIEIAARLGMVSPPERDVLLATAARVGQMLNRLHQSLERKIAREREEEHQRRNRQ
jgi:four helix bundle protein